ncbi:MAG: MoaD/ThiS family protein [Tissierellales bacterium]
MKVKVYPGSFCNTEALDEEGFIEIEEGVTVGDVIKRIKCPLPIKAFGLYMVNYRKVKLSTKLKDGDIISIITSIAGG